MSSPAAAQTEADAAGFLRGLYARYGRDGSFSPFADLATVEAIATPGLVGLVRREQQAASAAQDDGGLDADPVCGCQDSNGLRLAGLSVTPAGHGRATALATLRFGTTTVRRRFLLVAVDGAWRIDDIADGAGHGSVRAALARSIQDLQRKR